MYPQPRQVPHRAGYRPDDDPRTTGAVTVTRGLKQVARLYGIPNGCPDVDGSKVKDLTPDELTAYQTSDVRLVIALHERMNGVYFIAQVKQFPPVLSPVGWLFS